MADDTEQFRPRTGMTVYGADGEKVGTVDALEENAFVVRKGFFFPEDHVIPMDAVASVDDDTISLAYTRDQVLAQQWATGPAAMAGDEDSLHIDVHEEELVARAREVNRGEVTIRKDVVEEEQAIDVPVTEERVEVTRRAVDREVLPEDHAFAEAAIEVPVYGEDVEIEKHARVVEEIDVDRMADTHTERVRDTVRREEVEIEGAVEDDPPPR